MVGAIVAEGLIYMKERYFSLTAAAAFLSVLVVFVFCGSAETRDTIPSALSVLASYRPMRGLYVPNKKGRDIAYMKTLISEGKPLGVNMLVIDVHPYNRRKFIVEPEVMSYLKDERIYLVGRVVCFQDGLDKMPLPESELAVLRELVEKTAQAGFQEVQLDYIRFKDGGYPYPLQKKQLLIEELLKEFRTVADASGVKLSADVFGRIVFNRKDYVGQNLESFAKYTEVIYPMLYPSHFTGDRVRMSNPGKTVQEGLLKGQARLDGTGTVLHAYIQAFPYYIGMARTDLPGYVAMQIRATEETPARGWVAWNAAGNHSSVFEALRRIRDGKTEPSVHNKK